MKPPSASFELHHFKMLILDTNKIQACALELFNMVQGLYSMYPRFTRNIYQHYISLGLLK